MFRRIGKWLNGDSIGAELVGIIGNVVGGKLGIGRNRSVKKLIEKVGTHFDGDTNNNVNLY